jgi:hypothetical protein
MEYLAAFFLATRNVSDKGCKENQKTHFMVSKYFPKIVPLRHHVEKYGTAGQATDDTIIRRMPGN